MSGEQAQIGTDWVQFLLSSVALPAAISAGLSALVNYRMQLRIQRKVEEMGIIKEKLDLYAFLISRFDEMKYTFQILRTHKNLPDNQDGFVIRADEWQKFIEEMDNKIRQHYTLVDEEISQRWIYVKTLPAEPSSMKVLSDLRRMLVNEYNDIRKTDFKHVQHRIREISIDKPVVDFSKYKSNNNQASNPR